MFSFEGKSYIERSYKTSKQGASLDIPIFKQRKQILSNGLGHYQGPPNVQTTRLQQKFNKTRQSKQETYLPFRSETTTLVLMFLLFRF